MVKFLCIYFLVLYGGEHKVYFEGARGFSTEKECSQFALSDENREYMLNTFKNVGVNMVFPSCVSNDRYTMMLLENTRGI